MIGGHEPDAPSKWRFSIDVATAREAATTTVQLPQTRVALLRSAVIMSPDHGGAFDVLLKLVRLGLGGQNGDGRQYVSWIHEQDFVRAIAWIVEHYDLHGEINLSAPNPLPNRLFMPDLRRAWGIPLGLPATTWMLEVGALLLQTETELLLKSRRVVPARLLQRGFEFQFSSWPDAARDLCQQWRQRPR
ncbi:MAG: hypothetical protein Fur005_16990 [Roseiflexaceae bacterium]